MNALHGKGRKPRTSPWVKMPDEKQKPDRLDNTYGGELSLSLYPGVTVTLQRLPLPPTDIKPYYRINWLNWLKNISLIFENMIGVSSQNSKILTWRQEDHEFKFIFG